MITRELQLVRRPQGRLEVDDLRVAEVEVPALRDGQVLVRTSHHSVDAAIRIRMGETTPAGYLPPLALGAGLEGTAVGEVLESRAEGFGPGDLVQHARGYREIAVVDAGAALGGAGRLTRLDPTLAPPEVWVGLLGGTGLTAWAGLLLVCEVRPEDVVWVSAAAGAVGSVVAQLALARGCRVIGSAGSPAKLEYLQQDLGLHQVFNHRDGVGPALDRAAPDGIDVYFDSVGGDHLEAAIDHLRPFGRVALCGSISGYDGGIAAGPRNLFLATAKNLTLRGFRAGAFADRAAEAVSELADLWRAGRMDLRTDVYDGLEHAPQAMVDLFAGRNVGKVVVRT
ncbi:zinc-binding dehydrogenase [Nakamurella sp. YIM 132087]|uniref:Zinc-binding dehydrogenase n=1 Tax=Nakamurella alba TaxID=2665158 RepID=A0A7K1FKC8_9ACTN|nr:NADP-dependent oxidoreductase [Nakamurella alba]MTD14592.1 zinc-binding dehydrogenase [Nakamurella alba]